MQTRTLLLNMTDFEFSSLLTLCQPNNRSSLAQFCGSKEEAQALGAALDEIAWQLACSGNERAVEALSTRFLS